VYSGKDSFIAFSAVRSRLRMRNIQRIGLVYSRNRT